MSERKEEWSVWSFVGLLILSLLCPIVGWAVGGTNLKYADRKGQSIALILVGVIGALIGLCSAM